ncbi:flagellar filament capping protein FliD [Morganella psychrotolerans]|uniref:flagellar filament capping protein FliD n=1 Tax=Morganella psychrotolerans TaxID=368603 RepID=UPI0039B03628
MAGIASLGVGAGMDLNKQLDMLEAAEMRRLEPLAAQKTACDAQISAFGKLQSSLEKLKSAAEALKKYDDISTTKVSGEYKSFDVSTDGKAVPGVYDVRVDKLAKAQTIATAGQTDNKTNLGDGSGTRTIKITQGDGSDPKKVFEVTLDQEHTSLIEIADAINKKDKGVSAAVVKDSNNEFHLVLTSKTEGVDSRISVNVTGDTKLADMLNCTSGVKKEPLDSSDPKSPMINVTDISGNMEQKVAANNARLNINGFDIETSTNVVKDEFPGLKLTLKKESENGKADHLIISTDIEPAKNKIKAWVDAYNEYQKLSSELTKYTQTESGKAADKSNGPLIGDSTLRGIQNTMRGQIRTPNGSGEIDTMNKLGIKQKLDGTLEIDTKKLDKALGENSSSVKEFFAGDGEKTGFATENFNYLKKTLDSREGTIHNATDGLEKKKKGIDKRIEQTTKQIENSMDLYRRQFQNLDKMMSTLSGTTQALGKMLG